MRAHGRPLNLQLGVKNGDKWRNVDPRATSSQLAEQCGLPPCQSTLIRPGVFPGADRGYWWTTSDRGIHKRSGIPYGSRTGGEQALMGVG